MKHSAWKWSRRIVLSVGLAATAHAMPALADVEVGFSDFLASHMDSINRAELKREKIFRQYRVEGTRMDLSRHSTLGKSRRDQTEWAAERLIPNLEGYSVPALITAMLDRGVKAADPGFKGRMVVTIDKIDIPRYPVAVIGKARFTQMSGTVKTYDAAGKLVGEHKVSTSLIANNNFGGGYKGPDYAYVPAALSKRVGPLAAEFTEKLLETVYPGYDAPGLVVIQ